MNKEELLKKLKALADDTRGNENERKTAEEQLNKLLIKYNIDPESINAANLVKRDIYFKNDWEKKLIAQTIYKLFPEKNLYKSNNKRHWYWCEMTDAEYLEFEMYYCAYKASFEHEIDLFFTAFISKNNIFPDNPPERDDTQKSEMSRADRMRTAMMMEGIERTNVRRLLNEQN